MNVARVLHATGHDVLVVAPVGGSTGSLFLADLAMSGIRNRVVPTRAETRRSIAAVDTASGQATLLNEPGLPLRAEDADAVDALVLTLSPPAVVALCGSLPRATRHGASDGWWRRSARRARSSSSTRAGRP
ncbi:PfkB family carbohydrate kinase [Agromyces mangrovi Wang et al. 2018]|uniref:PfkB family carbohydrate kinase n=1 Tax=Agromyces mangrovi TaxID=1858653 RepID=UPI002572C4DB|nr:PfkB family carbohydrate kinase [Agromyces mangrovi]